MLDDAELYSRAGYAVHLLKDHSKAPAYANWSSRPVQTYEQLKKAYRPGQNIGVRTGEPSKMPSGQFLHIIDFDIRDPSAEDEAWGALDDVFPDHVNWPCVRSGSSIGRHFHVGTDRPYRYKIIEKSPDTFVDPKTGKVADRWKIEFYGTGKQVVLPPSIHPDTGKPYKWIREPKWNLADLGLDILPNISADTLSRFNGLSEDRKSADPDSLEEVVRLRPLGWSIDEIKDLLEDLPDEWVDRYDLWLKVGHCLSHEFDGGPDGLEIWHWFSEKSEKYEFEVLNDKWESFGKNRRPVTMKSLIGPAKENRIKKNYDDDDEDRNDKDDANKDDENDWFGELEFDKDGKIRNRVYNFKLILKNDPRIAGKLRYNEFTDEIVYTETIILRSDSKPMHPRDRINGSPIRDGGYANIRLFLEAKRSRKKSERYRAGWGLTISDRDLKDAVRLAAEDSTFNPVKDYIQSVEWDGVSRIEEIFIHFMGCEDTVYHRAVSRYMMLGAVTRIYEPGHKFDFVPIIEGAQGNRKSSWVEALGAHWFNELHSEFHDQKRLVETMQGAWVLEIPELSQFRQDDIRLIKAFFSGRMDKVRLSYRRDPEKYERCCIFIGTTNDRAYLSDNTGHRRFWPILAAHEIDIDEFKEIVPQLWAEALVLYRQMRKDQPEGFLPLFLTDREAAAEAKRVAEDRELESPEKIIAGRVSEWLDGKANGKFETRPRDITCVSDIWFNCFENPQNKIPTKAEANMYGRALDMIPEFKRIGSARMPGYGAQQKCWRRKRVEPKIKYRPTKSRNKHLI